MRLNNAGRTNLLESVTNPLGGTFTLTYDRFGNTVEHPDTTWAMTKVSVDDNREGDGADVQAISYDYSGLAFDRVHRQSLGFSQVIATERDTTDGDKPARITTTTYLNDNIFVAGLESSVQVTTPSGALLQRARTTWEFRDVRDVPAGFDVLAPVNTKDMSLIGDTSSVASRGRSIAPLAVRADEETFEGRRGATAQATRQKFTFRRLGQRAHPARRRGAGRCQRRPARRPTTTRIATRVPNRGCDLSASTMNEGTKYPAGVPGEHDPPLAHLVRQAVPDVGQPAGGRADHQQQVRCRRGRLPSARRSRGDLRQRLPDPVGGVDRRHVAHTAGVAAGRPD